MNRTLLDELPSGQREIIDQMEQQRFHDSNLVIQLGMKLLRLSHHSKYEYAKATAYLYISDAYLALGKSSRAVCYGLKGIKINKANHFFDLMPRLYNILGLAYVEQCQELYAVDCYKKGIEIAKKIGDIQLESFITNNIGIMYERLGEYTKAIEYFNLGYEASKKNEHSQNGLMAGAWNLNLSDAFNMLGKTKIAQEQLDLARQKLPEQLLIHETAIVENIQTNIYYQDCKYEKAYESACEVLESIKKHQRRLSYYPSSIELLLILIGIVKKGEKFLSEKAKLKVIYWSKYCSDMAKELQIPDKWMMYYDAMIDFYEYTNQQEELNQALAAYHKWTIEQNEVLRKFRLAGIKNRFIIDQVVEEKKEIQRDNEKLKKLSEIDILTGVKNRYALNQFLENEYPKMIDDHIKLGLIIIDIDYFKEYNDTYGHIAGDSCITMVAQKIKDVIPPEALIARYGGDEFFVLLKDKTDEEIQFYEKQIRDGVYGAKRKHEHSKMWGYVTVTQGAINCYPTKEKNITDYVHSADMILYQVKATKKNDFSFTSEFL